MIYINNIIIYNIIRILTTHLQNVQSISEITDAVHAMDKAIEKVLGIKQVKGKKVKRENLRIRKLRDQMKKLRQFITNMANEIHRRRVRRKATNKETKILAELRVTTKSKLTKTEELLTETEKWIDEQGGKK